MSPESEASEAQLLDAARRGDRRALEQLLAAAAPRLYRFGMKMCGDPEDAKDVLQESLLAAARSLSTFAGKSSFATWLYAIARSFCIRKRRQSKFAPADVRSLEAGGQETASLADDRALPDEALASRELGRRVDAALASLDPMYREVLILRDVEALASSEVAEVLGVSVPAVKSRLHRARAALRTALAPSLGPDEPGVAACPDIVTLFSENLEGEITAETCAEMQRHLGACPRCRRVCDSLKQILGLCRTPGPEVPAAVQESVRRELRRVVRAG